MKLLLLLITGPNPNPNPYSNISDGGLLVMTAINYNLARQHTLQCYIARISLK